MLLCYTCFGLFRTLSTSTSLLLSLYGFFFPTYNHWFLKVLCYGTSSNIHSCFLCICPQFLTSKHTFPKSFMLYNLNHLELRTGFTQYDLVGMAALLKISPNLETMVLDYLCKFSEDVSTFTYRIDVSVLLMLIIFLPCSVLHI